MFGLGMQEVVILCLLGSSMIGVPVGLFFVIQAAVRDGNRDKSPTK